MCLTTFGRSAIPRRTTKKITEIHGEFKFKKTRKLSSSR